MTGTIKKKDLGVQLAAIFRNAEMERQGGRGKPEFWAGKAFVVEELCEAFDINLAEELRRDAGR